MSLVRWSHTDEAPIRYFLVLPLLAAGNGACGLWCLGEEEPGENGLRSLFLSRYLASSKLWIFMLGAKPLRAINRIQIQLKSRN